MTAQYHTNLAVMGQLFARLSMTKRFSHSFSFGGVFLSGSENTKGERFLHILNLDDRPKVGDIRENGVRLFSQLSLDRKGALMLPQNVWALDDVCVISATAEIFLKTDHEITFRLTQPVDLIQLNTKKTVIPLLAGIAPPESITLTTTGNLTTLKVESHHFRSHLLTLAFA